jgi:hypothetical protein
MNSSATLPHAEVRTISSSRSNPVRYLYAGISVLLVVLVFLGFQQFYLHGRDARGVELEAPIKAMLIVHGLAMTAWMVLFLMQPLLIVGNRRRIHMSLGIFGAVLAACIVPLGIWAGIVTAKYGRDTVHIGSIHQRPFLAIQFNSMLMFGALVALGIWKRRRLEIHRSMLLLATLAIMGAATARMHWLRDLYAPTILGWLFGPYFIPLLLGVGFLAIKTALTRSFDRWFAGGLATLLVADVLTMTVARTATWERIANFLTR